MFQQGVRWLELVLHAGHRIQNGYYLHEVAEDLLELELLVRTEYQTAELEILIDQASDAFGVQMKDYLHE